MKKLVIKKREVEKVEVEIEEILEERLVDVRSDTEVRRTGSIIIDGSMHLIEERRAGGFKGRAIFLSCEFDWTLGIDDEGETCLVPLKKGEEVDV